MKTLFILLCLGFSFGAFAKQVAVQCHPKAYACIQTPLGLDCRWQTTAQGAEVIVQLNRDANYPNAHYPYEVWRGQYYETYDGHALNLDLVYSTENPRNPVTVNASLTTPSVTAESSGKKSVDVALRNQNYGRGFICPSIRSLD